jgi:hypothetical protein
MFRDVAQRLINAETEFIKSIMEAFGYSEFDASIIFHVLHREKILKLHTGIGRYTIVHGALWDKTVMANALKLA